MNLYGIQLLCPWNIIEKDHQPGDQRHGKNSCQQTLRHCQYHHKSRKRKKSFHQPGFSDPVHPPFFLTDSGIDIVERLRHLNQAVGNDTQTRSVAVSGDQCITPTRQEREDTDDQTAAHIDTGSVFFFHVRYLIIADPLHGDAVKYVIDRHGKGQDSRRFHTGEPDYQYTDQPLRDQIYHTSRRVPDNALLY